MRAGHWIREFTQLANRTIQPVKARLQAILGIDEYQLG
jgi:hypothetical protein